jgi:hypothetical protein
MIFAMEAIKHVYEVRPRSDKRGVDLISDVLPFGRLKYETKRPPRSASFQLVLGERRPNIAVRKEKGHREQKSECNESQRKGAVQSISAFKN